MSNLPIQISRNLRLLLGAIFLFMIWLIFVFPSLSAAYSFAIWRDNEYMLAPVLAQTSQIIREGEWPLWIDSILGGFPIYNFTQLSAFYPFYGTLLPIYTDPFTSARSMHLLTLAHMLILLINSFILLRTIRVGLAAALAGAALMTFNLNFLLYSCWINIIAPYSWLPLFLAGVIRLLAHPHSMRAFGMCLLAVVLLTTASPAQPLIHAVLLSGLLVLAHAWRLRAQTDRTLLLAGIRKFVIVGLFAVAVCAPVILPAALEYPKMIRWLGPISILGHEKIPFEYFLVDQMALKDLAGVLFPLDHTPAVGNPLIGLIPVLLALIACIRRNHLSDEQRWLIWPLLILAVYALLSACGSNSGLAYINYYLPLINQIREPSRFLVLAHFSVAVLAAVGLAQLPALISNSAKHPVPGQRRVLLGVGLLMLIALLVASFAPLNRDSGLRIWLPLCFGLGIFLALWQGLPARLNAGVSRYGVISAAALVLCTQYLLVPWQALPISMMSVITTQKVDLLNVLRRVGELDPERQYRVIFEGDIDKQAAGMLASYYQVRNFNAYINPAPAALFNNMYYHGSRGKNYFAAMGAKYLICAPCSAENTAGYSLLEQHGEYGIYHASALPRYYFSTRPALEYANFEDYLTKIASVDLGTRPVLTSTGSWQADATEAAGRCTHLPIRQSHNRLRLMANCSNSALLVLNEFDGGNWRATLDGVKAPMMRVNGNQIGIVVKAGSSLIEVSYQPRKWRYALWVGLIGLLSLGVYLLHWRAKRNLVIH